MPISLVSIFNIEPPADATANANLQFNSSTGRAEWVSEYSFQGTVSGYASGGASPATNIIDKFPFPTDANATDVGDLTSVKVGAAGQSSIDYGYSAGGASNAPGSTKINIIDRFSFAAGGNASDVGDLSQIRDRVAGQSSSSSGYTSGGESPAVTNTIDKFPFASNSNASDVGDLSQSRSELTGQSSKDNGYSSAGNLVPGTADTIDKFPFATNGNATDVGNLTQARLQTPAGQSSVVSGYTSGGGTPNRTTIDKFPFATDANATDVGNLTFTRRRISGQSSTTSGYASGGFTTIDSSRIDKFPFATDANATDIANLSVARYDPAGHQY